MGLDPPALMPEEMGTPASRMPQTGRCVENKMMHPRNTRWERSRQQLGYRIEKKLELAGLSELVFGECQETVRWETARTSTKTISIFSA